MHRMNQVSWTVNGVGVQQEEEQKQKKNGYIAREIAVLILIKSKHLHFIHSVIIICD